MKATTIAWSVALALGLASVAHAAETLRYVVVMSDGHKAGEQVVEHGDDGRTRVSYIFKDNGRGPELKEEYSLRPDGTFADYKVTGTSTYGSKIDESFRRDGDKAIWKSTSESGEATVGGTAHYSPLGGTMQAGSLALGLLARSADGTLSLLPSGTLRQRVLQELEVESDGARQTVQLVAQTGVSMSPQFAWATKADAASKKDARLFAYIAPGYLAAIEEGWEGNVEKMTAIQKAADDEMVKDFAARQFKSLDGLTVVRNARVFDSIKGTLGASSDVYVLRGRITAILPAGAPNAGVEHEIDAAGRVMLPGLFDMHAHESGRFNGGLHLAAGVTTVRDMGNDNATLQQLIDATARGEVLQPRIVPAGFLEGQSDFSSRSGFVINNLDEAKHAIDWYAQHGYPQLKIYNSFPKAILTDTVAYAHTRGMRVSGHVPAFLRAQDVIDAGFDEIQHINQLLLNFLVEPTTDTRTLERFRLPADKVADLDFDGKPVQDFIASLKKHGVAVDPTLTTFDFIRQRAGETPKSYAAVIDHLPLETQRAYRAGSMDIPDDATAERYNRSYEKMVEFVGRLHKAGITIVPGTDEIAGFTLHRELELLVQAGLTPVEALQSATSVSARVARVDTDRGRIEPGLLADLVLVDGDPTKDINAIRKVALVLTQGRVVSPNAVYAELGVKPFVSEELVVKTLAAKGTP